MPNYRRARIPGGTYFFTVVTNNRLPIFADDKAQQLLGDCFREAQQRWPFEITAIVLLPEHLHTIWTLPRGDDTYSKRWAWIKKEFTKRWTNADGMESSISISQLKEGRRGVWQPRFWEHVLETDHDFERHFDYIHFNPVKHELVNSPKDWSASSFHRWVAAGVYPNDWASSPEDKLELDFTQIESKMDDY